MKLFVRANVVAGRSWDIRDLSTKIAVQGFKLLKAEERKIEFVAWCVEDVFGLWEEERCFVELIRCILEGGAGVVTLLKPFTVKVCHKIMKVRSDKSEERSDELIMHYRSF